MSTARIVPAAGVAPDCLEGMGASPIAKFKSKSKSKSKSTSARGEGQGEWGDAPAPLPRA